MITNQPIRVLIVDDSAFMRSALGRVLGQAKDIQVVGKARNGAEAVDQAKTLKPDLITLDIEMPEMDGLTALRLIRQFTKAPIIMVSSLTTEGSVASLRALRYGASDYLAKDQSMISSNIDSMADDLIAKVRALTEKRIPAKPVQLASTPQTPNARKATNPARLPDPKQFDLVVIGSSTGAPPQLELIVKALPENFPVPVVIAQHMPPAFTKSLAQHLDSFSAIRVIEAHHGMGLQNNTVTIAPGGLHTKIVGGAKAMSVRIGKRPTELVYKPSVDELFRSAAGLKGVKTLGIVLTGMGDDGVLGAQEIHNVGGKLITQTAESCVVYGMPKAVDEANISDASLTPEQIALYLNPKATLNTMRDAG